MVGSHATQSEIGSGRSDNCFEERFGGAFFWPANEGAPQPGVRVLNGELEVKKSLKLGFVFPRFSIRVSAMSIPATSGTASTSPLVMPISTRRL